MIYNDMSIVARFLRGDSQVRSSSHLQDLDLR
jgi:hypothetical protein